MASPQSLSLGTSMAESAQHRKLESAPTEVGNIEAVILSRRKKLAQKIPNFRGYLSFQGIRVSI
jgi:hypothetical protein